MQLAFEKWHGSGNDFILIDDRAGSLPRPLEWIRSVCERNRGIGSDGIIFIEEGEQFNMDFYNPDGSQSFCGNGSRCAFAFFSKLNGGIRSASFNAIDGGHVAEWDDERVRVQMRDSAGFERISEHVDLIDTGSPHLIVWCQDPEKIDLIADARAWRYNDRFKNEGVNVNFVAWVNDAIRMRTYERGVEAETLSCGTGVTAAALSAIWRGKTNKACDVFTRGGDLRVEVGEYAAGSARDIKLIGPVQHVYHGMIELP